MNMMIILYSYNIITIQYTVCVEQTRGYNDCIQILESMVPLLFTDQFISYGLIKQFAYH